MILAILTAANLLCHYFWPVLHYITVFGESAGAMATADSRHEHARPLSPPISLVERAMNRVRDHIRDNDLKVGDTLPGEGQFAAKLGVSRPVMREAFGALAALRQIDVGNGRRARVAAIDGSVMASSIDHAVATAPVSVADVRDVRRALELRTVVLAAQNCTNEQGDEIMAAARAMADAADDLTRLSRAAPSHRQG